MIEYEFCIPNIPANRQVRLIALIVAIAEWRGEEVGGIEYANGTLSFMLDTRSSDQVLAKRTMQRIRSAIAHTISIRVRYIWTTEVKHE